METRLIGVIVNAWIRVIKRMHEPTRVLRVRASEEKGFYLIKRADRKRRLALLQATALTVGKNDPLSLYNTMNNWFAVSLFCGLRNNKGG